MRAEWSIRVTHAASSFKRAAVRVLRVRHRMQRRTCCHSPRVSRAIDPPLGSAMTDAE